MRQLLTMTAVTFTLANADFDRRHSTSEIGQSLPNFTIRNISVRPPIADMRADIAGRRFGPILLKNSPVETVKAH